MEEGRSYLMKDETRTQDAQKEPASAPEEDGYEDDWIGEIEDKARAFRDAMSDVAREADEGVIDGTLGKVIVFLKRYWALMLVTILPFVPGIVDNWAANDPFPAVPEIITEAEVQEISDYALAFTAAHDKTINWALRFDRDGDGEEDTRFYAFACEEPERGEWYIRTSMELPNLWQVITGQCGLAPQKEEIAIQDGHVCMIVTVDGETARDRSELRWVVEQVLVLIRKDLADGGITLPTVQRSPLDDILPDIS